MDPTRYTVSIDELRLFHRIDRTVFTYLVRNLSCRPEGCMYIMALWLWFERVCGFSGFISIILQIPHNLIDKLADEAIACLKCLNVYFTQPLQTVDIPLTKYLAQKEISLEFFQRFPVTTFNEIQKLIQTVCIPVYSDIILNLASRTLPANNPAQLPMVGPVRREQFHPAQHSMQSRPVSGETSNSRGRSRNYETTSEIHEKTMFSTFSKGYPVSEAEVREFFEHRFRKHIQEFHMQEVQPGEQALYARIVFSRPSDIVDILGGSTNKVKFSINGKHVWMRKYTPRNERRA